MSALKHLNCSLKRFDGFVMIYCRILCQLATTSKKCLRGHIAARCFQKKNQNLEYDLMSEGYLGQHLQKSSHHYMVPKETAPAIQTVETFLSIPRSSSHTKAWQIIIALCSILLFLMKLNPKRPGRSTSIAVAGRDIVWVHIKPAQIIRPPCGGNKQQIRKFLYSEDRK